MLWVVGKGSPPSNLEFAEDITSTTGVLNDIVISESEVLEMLTSL